MKNNLENLNLEPNEPYQVRPEILEEVREYLRKAADPDLKFEDWQKMQAEFAKKADADPEYRLAYLRESTKRPDAITRFEMYELERQLRDRDKGK